MTITPFIARYRIKEFIQFVRNSLMIVSQHNPDQLKVRKQYNTLMQAHRQLELAYKRDNGDVITPRLTELDNARDQAIVSLRMISEGYTRHYDPALSSAGQQVIDCIDKYGARLYSLNYSAKTTALKNLVRDLQTIPVCAQAIRAIHLEKLIGEMKRSNLTFEQQFIEHLEASSRASAETMRELMQSTTEAYRTLVKHLEAHATLTPSSEYTLFINHLNENTEYFNQVVERRKSEPAEEGDLSDASSDEGVEVAV